MQTISNFFGKATKPSSVSVSLPRSIKVRGYTIKKMPIGAYLTAMETLQDLPMQLMEALFPGQDASGILAQLTALDKDGLSSLLMRALTETITRLKNAAAFGGAAHLSLAQKVQTATEGLKNENSILEQINKRDKYIIMVKRR